MIMFNKNKSGKFNILVQIAALLMIFAIIAVAVVSIPSFRKSGGRIRAESIEETITKYAVQCYASEGSYPPTLDYLVDHYGLVLDKEHYFYYYEAYSSNFMPNIKVYSRMRPRR